MDGDDNSFKLGQVNCLWTIRYTHTVYMYLVSEENLTGKLDGKVCSVAYVDTLFFSFRRNWQNLRKLDFEMFYYIYIKYVCLDCLQ